MDIVEPNHKIKNPTENAKRKFSIHLSLFVFFIFILPLLEFFMLGTTYILIVELCLCGASIPLLLIIAISYTVYQDYYCPNANHQVPKPSEHRNVGEPE